MTIKISAVIITKNEEGMIGRCIKSLTGVQEVIVLDTGSTDETVDIASGLGAKVTVIDKPIVPFHFAEARNMALKLATNDWILSIDADEVVRPGAIKKVRDAIEKNPDFSAMGVTFTNQAEGDATYTASISKTKFFRKSAWGWQYRVHERLVPIGDNNRIGLITKALIDHLPAPDKRIRHGQNIDLLKLCIQENPEYIRAYRHLGQELMLQKKWLEAVPHLAQYAEKTEEGPLHKSEALMHIGRCYAESDRLEEGLNWFALANETDPRRREPLFHAALNLIKKCRLDEALVNVKKMLDIPITAKPDTHLDLPHVWTDTPIKMLAFCNAEIAKAKALAEAK